MLIDCARVSLLLALSLCGCAGSIDRQHIGPSGTGGATPLGTPDTGGNSGWDAGEDSGDASPVALGQCTDGSAPPAAAASKQRITFVLRNTSSERRFVATDGTFCTPFAVAERSGVDWSSLTLATGRNGCDGRCELCACDGGKPVPSRLVALDPGETYSMNWDARSYASCEVPIAECPDKTKRVGASHPVAPGPYLLSVPLASAVPSNCTADDQAASYTCGPTGLAGCNWSLPMCQLESTVSVEFSVPEAGDLQVDVPLE